MDLPKYTLEINDNDVECPYCHNKWQLEGEDFSEDAVEEECECGKKFYRECCISYDVRSRPNCELNGEQHTVVSDGEYKSCSTCDAFLGTDK